MTDARPAFTAHDTMPTLLFAAIGCLLGFGILLTVLLISDGLWMILLFLIPIAILHLVGHGVMHMLIWGLAAFWALARGTVVPTRPPTLPAPHHGPHPRHPWLRENALLLAIVISITVILTNAWRTGVVTEGFL